MSTYELYLAVHIGAASAWVGGQVLMTLLGTRAIFQPDPATAVRYAHDSEWLGLRLFLPANLVVLAFGFLLMSEGWAYDQLWVQLGLAGAAASFLTGAVFFGPGWARVAKLAASEGADSKAVQARIRRLVSICFIDLGILAAVVFEMTVKPTADDEGALAVTAAIPALLALFGYVLVLRAGRRAPEEAVLEPA